MNARTVLAGKGSLRRFAPLPAGAVPARDSRDERLWREHFTVYLSSQIAELDVHNCQLSVVMDKVELSVRVSIPELAGGQSGTAEYRFWMRRCIAVKHWPLPSLKPSLLRIFAICPNVCEFSNSQPY